MAAPNFSRFWIMMISTTIQLLVYQRSIGKYRPGIHSALFLPDLQEVPDFHCSPAHNNTGLYIITSEKLITLRGKKSVNYWSFFFLSNQSRINIKTYNLIIIIENLIVRPYRPSSVSFGSSLSSGSFSSIFTLDFKNRIFFF